MNLGISGRLTQATIHSPLTPLALLAAIAVGLMALLSIPREEEPQISVPMVDIMVATPGLRAADGAELVAKPLETIVKSIDAVDHVYTQVQDDQVLVTARFDVGEDPEDAAVRVHEKIRANYDQIPVGIPEPMIVTRGINDVPAVVLTLTPTPEMADRWSDQALYDVALKLRTEVAKVEDVGLTFIVGGRPDEIRIEPDPERLALRGVPLGGVIEAVRQANRSFPAGAIRQDGQAVDVAAGRTLASAQEVGLLGVASVKGEPVYVRDVATVIQAPREDQARVWRHSRTAEGWTQAPAVSLAIAKRQGANAVVVSEHILERVETLRGTLIPEGLEVAVSRDYGESANEKANELLFHLGLATVSIVILIGLAIGWREAGVTAVVIPTTILLTLFASNLMGYTINRVSLFALIFSIGILVDDAIVMIENIARHWAMKDGRTPTQAAIEAVAEVGNPTVVATLTVVAALLPMLFVSGLMGPYMAPIPVNASAAMVFSFFVAVVIAPWLMVRFARQTLTEGHGHGHDEGGGRLGGAYRALASRVIATRRSAWIFLGAVGLATLLSMSMFATKTVTVKLLPFDNKSELQVVLDLPEGASLETTERTLAGAAAIARTVPEVTAIEAYAGTASPFNFNGLVRHYFLRDRPEMGDLSITLSHKGDRKRASHAIALDLRERLAALPLPTGGSVKVVEAPPGPPVMATLLAEIYGPDAETRRAVAAEVKGLFQSVPYIVDVDDSYGEPRPRLRLTPARDTLEHLGVAEGQVLDSIGAVFGGGPVGYAHRGEGRTPLEIAVRLPQSDRTWGERLAATPVAVSQTADGVRLVELGEVVDAVSEPGSHMIYRRDGLDAEMVTAELAGQYEAPIYGMLAVGDAIEAHDWGDLPKPTVRLNGQPSDESAPTLLWDGEWEITWVTFRDMGAAFAVAILGIYVLVVAQFKSFRLPLVILTPIPLTLVGIVIGHIIFSAPFSATSMIGFIALAGIIVRNSILLVDFIRHAQTGDRPLRDVLLEAGAIRFKPIVLTAAAAMIGAAVILFDPIFQGLAISLLFGLASSTLLTVLVIPAIYVVLRDDGRPATRPGAAKTA
ncbi:efflux RND transporter permease subunit [Phenylobacterium sp.]|jgi:multidrug efflux pump subunit AcrB|uniref:efflux RND transporter permease subunit n=1 Tax=Phenylobacterium sp. TaxID=1871053 RepID=UPI000C936845|nr:efflux RND transporter permease subunit [Phenylobacterium sp.]MAK83528.1 multidrug transporter AcrB [Phenylobacterium sp.]|tara:strand:+ start:20167 stop:23400 length:3234 start_codon:yes stop_codon:yes gene_type:complete